jgi:hypothetical protein
LQDGTKFDVLGRVVSGTLTNHSDVKVRLAVTNTLANLVTTTVW